jgi:hypothetical protein
VGHQSWTSKSQLMKHTNYISMGRWNFTGSLL